MGGRITPGHLYLGITYDNALSKATILILQWFCGWRPLWLSSIYASLMAAYTWSYPITNIYKKVDVHPTSRGIQKDQVRSYLPKSPRIFSLETLTAPA